MAISQNPSPITLLQAKAFCCRPAGTSADAVQLVNAADHIRGAMYTLNNKRNWTWLQVAAAVTANANATSIALPSRAKRIYDVMTPTGPLEALELRDMHRQNPDSVALGALMAYTAFDAANNATTGIRLYDPPTTNTPITVDYLRLLTLPVNDNDTFDVPEQVMDYILNEAAARYLTERGRDEGAVAFYAMKAKEALIGLLKDDFQDGDHDLQILPSRVIPSLGYRNTAWYWIGD